MIDYQPLYEALLDVKAEAWVDLLPQQISDAFDLDKHGTLSDWLSIINSLPNLTTTHRSLTTDAVEIGQAGDLLDANRILF